MSESKLSILVLAEHDNNKLSVDTLRTLKAADELATTAESAEITLLILGKDCQSVVDAATRVEKVSHVEVLDNEAFEHVLAESASEIIAERGGKYTHILAAATTFGKNILPRAAALLDVGQLSDVVKIETPETVIRPIYAGNALARVKSNDAIKIITVRSSVFEAAQCGDVAIANVVHIDNAIPSTKTEFVSMEKTESARPELPAARVVISGGRGLGSKENFALVEKLADKLNGAIGASRAAVDAGFVSNDLQVGQTGKIVAPDLYIAIGISGAIQHLAGMKDSKVIVAINNDPEAPIFQIADYGLVGDLFEVMPELIESIE